MSSELQKICIGAEQTLRSVLEVLQQCSQGTCIVVDLNRKVLGTITDGDCRRALLRGHTLDSAAGQFMHTNFIAVEEDFPKEQLQSLMRTNGIHHVPIVDSQRRLVEVFSFSSAEKATQPRKNAALILAGGKGQRLAPLTNIAPKPLLPVAGKPMIERIIENLVASRITNIFISVNYLGKMIEEFIGDGSARGCKITYLKEESELGTAGPLRLMQGHTNDPILIVNGDLVTKVDYGACVDFYSKHSADFLIGVSTYSVQIPFGVVSSDAQGNVTTISEKPVQSFQINAGLYVANPDLISMMPETSPYLMTDFIELLARSKKKVKAFPIHESWMDVGLPQQYIQAQQQFAD